MDNMSEIKFNKGRHFEERLMQAMMIDHPFAEQMLEVLDVQYFSLDFLKEMAGIMFDYYKKYNTFPSFGLLKTIFNTEIKSEIIKNQIFDYCKGIKDNPLNGDMEWIKDTSLDFCKKRKLLFALEKSLDLAEQKNYDQVSSEIQKALALGSDKNVGHIFGEHFDARMMEIVRKPITTGWKEIDEITKGGPNAGDLCYVMAPTAVGKSHFLVNVGGAAAKAGFNVVHYTLELSEIDIANRYDAYFTNIPSDNLRERKDEVKSIVSAIPGKIIIKGYPTRSASVVTLKNHIRKLALRDIKPDLVIVDYGDIMKSTKNYDQKRLEQESVSEELRQLAGEICCPVWTASQINRSGMDEEVIGLGSVSECFAKVMIADFCATMSGARNIFIAKNRMGPGGLTFPYKISTSTSRITFLSDDDKLDLAEIQLRKDIEASKQEEARQRYLSLLNS